MNKLKLLNIIAILLVFNCSKQETSLLKESGISTKAVAWNSSNYYISNLGDDGNDGKSESSAWKTISKINSTAFTPGDSIFFRRGDTWAETLLPSTSGEMDKRITYDAYGSGENPKITGLPNNSGITWTSSLSYLTFRNLKLHNCGKPSGVNEGGINVYNNSGTPSFGIIIEDLDISGSRTWNIYMSGVQDLIIRYNTISYAQEQHGIYLDGSEGVLGVMIDKNIIFENAQNGIQFNSNDIWRIKDATVRYNRIYNCGVGGINNLGADALLCHSNIIYGPMTSIYNSCDQYDKDCSSGARNGKYYNNTLVTSGSGFATCFSNVGGDSTRVDNIKPSYTAFKNNICLHGASMGAIFEDNGNSVNIVNDFNLYYNTSNASSQIAWKNIYHNNFTDYAAYTGQDPNGLYGNPMLNTDYSLMINSPAIDSGFDLSIITQDIENVSIPQGPGPDIGAFEFQ